MSSFGVFKFIQKVLFPGNKYIELFGEDQGSSNKQLSFNLDSKIIDSPNPSLINKSLIKFEISLSSN